MRRVALLLLVGAGTARADDQAPPTEPPAAPSQPTAEPTPDPGLIARLRELYDHKDYDGVRRELVAAYAKAPHSSLLFALGQVELQLGHYQAAIDYYDRFIATKPPQDQIDLAQQAIGAARIQLANAKPRRHREWHRADTAVVVLGGVAVAAGASLYAWGHHKSFDRSGTLDDYDRRLDRAHVYEWSGMGLGAAGVVAAGIAVVRWRLRPEDGYEVSVSPTGVAVSGRW